MKLSTNDQDLHALFDNLRKVKVDLRSSVAIVIKEMEVFWDKVDISIRRNVLQNQ